MPYVHPSVIRTTSSGNSDHPIIWTHKTTDAIAVVEAAGYFNDAVDDFTSDDIIFIAMSDGNKMYRVTVTATVVTLNSIATLTTTTDSTTGTGTTTLNDVTASFSQTILNDNFATIADQLNALQKALGNVG
jgi:hypothetical protein